MSHIPNNAMPHAGPTNDRGNQGTPGTSTGSTASSGGAFSQLADKAREYPKTAIAAGAVVAAGVVAAATLTKSSRDGAKNRSKSRKND